MARYEHLPLYKLIYDFILYFFKLSDNFSKGYKYGFANEVRDSLLRLLEIVIIANNNTNKVENLKNAEIELEKIKIKIRLLKDLKLIGLKSYCYCAKQLISIGKQLYAWKNWSQKG